MWPWTNSRDEPDPDEVSLGDQGRVYEVTVSKVGVRLVIKTDWGTTTMTVQTPELLDELIDELRRAGAALTLLRS